MAKKRENSLLLYKKKVTVEIVYIKVFIVLYYDLCPHSGWRQTILRPYKIHCRKILFNKYQSWLENWSKFGILAPLSILVLHQLQAALFLISTRAALTAASANNFKKKKKRVDAVAPMWPESRPIRWNNTHSSSKIYPRGIGCHSAPLQEIRSKFNNTCALTHTV